MLTVSTAMLTVSTAMLTVFPCRADMKGQIGCAAVAPHLDLVVVGMMCGKIAVYTFRQFRFQVHLQGHSGEVTAIAFLPGHPAMVSADAEGHVYFWPVSPVSLKCAFPSVSLSLLSVALSCSINPKKKF
jgi:WD40 repeat protein